MLIKLFMQCSKRYLVLFGLLIYFTASFALPNDADKNIEKTY